MDHSTLADQIDALLIDGGDPERAQREQAYLKSDLGHYGTPVPVIRAAVTRCARRFPDLDHHELVTTVETLWRDPVHERRMAAVELLMFRSALLEPHDMDLLERLLRGSRTWALVDNLASSVAGPMVERSADATAVLDRWATDDEFWIRRSAMLALLIPLRNGSGDFERFGRYADQMLEETEFFIRTAIGWILRDTAKRRPDMVDDWLMPRAHRASGVTLREAVKPLSDEQRAAVLATARGR